MPDYKDPYLNRCQFTGRLVHTPETKATSGGLAVTRFSVAVNFPKGKGEQKPALFVECVAFDAPWAAELQKAAPVLVEGRMEPREWTGRDGEQKKSVELVCSLVRAMTFAEGDSPARPAQTPPRAAQRPARASTPDSEPDPLPPLPDDDIPF